jgi:integrase
MASVFRRKYNKAVGGRKVKKQSTCWYVKYRDADGLERRVKGYPDKEATRQMAARLEKETALAHEGVVDRYKEHRGRPLSEHLEDFRQSLIAKGNTKGYVDTILARATRIVEGCKFVRWDDIQASQVQRYLAALREGEDDISAQTFNFYLQAIKQFCKWMVQDQRAMESPVGHLKGLNVKVDRRHDRRAFQPDEVKHLLATTATAPKRFGATGSQRAMLYRLAVETGLRANELRTLKVSSFDLDECTVTVQAAYSKRKREDVLPLRPDTAAELRGFLSDKLPDARVFRVPDKPVKMLRADLADADIVYVDEAGRYADFHALRHTTGSWLAANGVHPKIAQTIMRHSDINLTMSRYTHTLTGQEAEAVKSLPSLSLSGTEAQRATGTDGRPELTPESTPKSTLPPFSVCSRLSVDGTKQALGKSKSANRKCSKTANLDAENTHLSPIVTGESGQPTVGFEPTTPGLQNQSSTVELRWREESAATLRQGIRGPRPNLIPSRL